MSSPSARSSVSQARAARGFSALVGTMARPLLVGLLLVLLLVYCNVLQGSVQRGEQLNRQMADAASRCDSTAARRRASNCTRPVEAGALPGGPVQRQQLAAR